MNLLCLLLGHKERLAHVGVFEYVDEKLNKPKRVVLEGYGRVYECERCKNQRVRRINDEPRFLKKS